jgi:hypothetical protein
MRAAARAAQPGRLKLAAAGRDVLASGLLGSAEKFEVNAMLDRAFDPRAAIFEAAGVFLPGSESRRRRLQVSSGNSELSLPAIRRMYLTSLSAACPLAAPFLALRLWRCN